MKTRGLLIAAAAATALLWAGTVLAKGPICEQYWHKRPTCEQRQSYEADKLLDQQNECVEKLTKYGCNAGVCSLGLDECEVELQTCREERDQCTAALAECQKFGKVAATGQTTCWLGGNDSTDPTPAACAGTGQDGQYTAGATLAFVDNGDGTITDSNSGLMWEKKSDDGSLHDKDTFYPWVSTCTGDGTTWCTRDNDCAVPGGSCSGTTIFEWVDQVNAANFAMHNDWRVPNVRELASLVDYGHYYPTPPVSVEFNNGCGVDSSGNPGCAVTTCSCTVPTGYWSSSTVGALPRSAYSVSFIYGAVGYGLKENSVDSVRAVRAGL